MGWPWWWLVGCEAGGGGWGESPPHHPASGGSSWVGGRFSITLLQESGSWVWDCGITGRQPGVCRGGFLSVMGRPRPSTPPTPSPHTPTPTHTLTTHQQHNSLQTPCAPCLSELHWSCSPASSDSWRFPFATIDVTKWMCEEMTGLAAVLSANTEIIYWIADQPPE